MKKNLLTSLKNLLKVLGGNSNKNNIVGVIDDISEQISESEQSGGGSSSDLILNINNVKPIIVDGVEYDHVYVESSDGNSNVVEIAASLFCLLQFSKFELAIFSKYSLTAKLGIPNSE